MLKNEWIFSPEGQRETQKQEFFAKNDPNWKERFRIFLEHLFATTESTKEDLFKLDNDGAYAEKIVNELVPEKSPFRNIQIPRYINATWKILAMFDADNPGAELNGIYFDSLTMITEEIKKMVSDIPEYKEDICVCEYEDLKACILSLNVLCKETIETSDDYNKYNKALHVLIENTITLMPLII